MTLPDEFQWLEEAGLSEVPRKIRCPECFQKLDLSLFPALTQAQCPACGREVTVPVTFAGFNLYKLLSESRTCRIYQARDNILERDIALKSPRVTERNEYYRAGFERLATLAHPGVLWIYTSCDYGEYTCGALQLMNEGAVTKPNRIREKFGFERLLDSLIPVANALCMVKSRRMVHRDICPANLFCDSDGVLRLANFRPGDGEWPLPGDNWRYRCPEALMFQNYSPIGDLFSFAVTVYELFSGHYPYGEIKDVTALSERQHQPVRPLNEINPLVGRPLAEVLGAAMDSDPFRRPQAEKLERCFREALAAILGKYR